MNVPLDHPVRFWLYVGPSLDQKKGDSCPPKQWCDGIGPSRENGKQLQCLEDRLEPAPVVVRCMPPAPVAQLQRAQMTIAGGTVAAERGAGGGLAAASTEAASADLSVGTQAFPAGCGGPAARAAVFPGRSGDGQSRTRAAMPVPSRLESTGKTEALSSPKERSGRSRLRSAGLSDAPANL